MLILTVEDDDAIRESIGEVLSYAGHTVLAASNGQEAINILETADVKPDLILLDLMMPVMDGWVFMEESIKNPSFLAIPIVIVSAVVSECRLNAHPSVRGIIQKPIKLDQFLRLIQEISDSNNCSSMLSELN